MTTNLVVVGWLLLILYSQVLRALPTPLLSDIESIYEVRTRLHYKQLAYQPCASHDVAQETIGRCKTKASMIFKRVCHTICQLP